MGKYNGAVITTAGANVISQAISGTELTWTVMRSSSVAIPEGTDIVRVTRVCTADGRPVIYCEDVLEKRLIKGEFTLKDLEKPIFHFLKQVCDIYAYMDLTRVHAALASDEIAGILNVEVGTPLLNMEETDYDIDGNILFYSTQYFVDGFFEQTVLRKKI